MRCPSTNNIRTFVCRVLEGKKEFTIKADAIFIGFLEIMHRNVSKIIMDTGMSTRKAKGQERWSSTS